MGGIQLFKVSSHGRYPVMRGRQPFMGGILLLEVYSYGYVRCLVMRGVQQCETSSYVRCPVIGIVQICEVSSYGRCPVI